MEYRIERAKTGRSGCRHCGMTIPEGSWRFGKDGQISRWFHLACAAEGTPRAYKPFRVQGDALLAAEKPAEPAQAASRNSEAEALLANAPDDADARRIFSDFLQSRGDPWGEILALYQAGEGKAARKLFKTHQDDLCGGIATKCFDWKDGLMVDALLEGKLASVKTQLERFKALRTSFTVSRLRLPVPVDVELAEQVSRGAPPALRSLFLYWGAGLDALQLPQLTKLSLFVPKKAPLTPTFFSGTHLPALESLEMYSNSNPVPAELLDGLLSGELVPRLTGLRLFQGALDAAGAERVIAHADAVKHIPNLVLDIPGSMRGRAVKALGRAAF